MIWCNVVVNNKSGWLSRCRELGQVTLSEIVLPIMVSPKAPFWYRDWHHAWEFSDAFQCHNFQVHLCTKNISRNMKKGTLWPAKVAERGFRHTSGGRESCHVVPLVEFVGWTTIKPNESRWFSWFNQLWYIIKSPINMFFYTNLFGSVK